jgi:hypothetical protein
MPDDPDDFLEAGAQLVIELIDLMVDLLDTEMRVHAAMIIDDETGWCLPDAHIMHVAQAAGFGGLFDERGGYIGACRGCDIHP